MIRELPTLQEILKSFSKKDLWNRIQEKNKQIAELEEQLNNSEQACLICHKDQENELLKKYIAELEEQLKNAIVPKFKVGQEVYYYHIGRNKIYSGYVEDIQWFATRNEIHYRISQLQRDYFWIREDEVFATKEEAQAKLEELKGENK